MISPKKDAMKNFRPESQSWMKLEMRHLCTVVTNEPS